MDSELVAEQLLHTIDNLRFEIVTIGVENDHECALLEHRIIKLEEYKKDHEERIRSIQSGVLSFKMWTGLASACAVIASVLALIKALTGG